MEYHFKTHAADAGASDIDQYVRKAEEFSQNPRGARRDYLNGGFEGAVSHT
jgi:pyocin large subunit-like protein